MENSKSMQKYRYFLKDSLRLNTDFSKTDQNLGIKAPALQKEIDKNSTLIPLPPPKKWAEIEDMTVIEAINHRKSRRRYADRSISIDQLSFLLWATQGVRTARGKVVLRTTPSAGNRHPFETYICALNIKGLKTGIYLYRPLEHGLINTGRYSSQQLAHQLVPATLGQHFITTAAAVIVWTAIPYRTEWRYGKASHKVIALDAGHVCQNLYLACECIHAGTCAVAAYHQELMDKLIGVDGQEEFVIYLAPVGLLR